VGASAELLLQDGGQRKSHPRQPYFRDEKRWWYDVRGMEGKEGSEGHDSDGGKFKEDRISGTWQ
jgi:hypothetical protein